MHRMMRGLVLLLVATLFLPLQCSESFPSCLSAGITHGSRDGSPGRALLQVHTSQARGEAMSAQIESSLGFGSKPRFLSKWSETQIKHWHPKPSSVVNSSLQRIRLEMARRALIIVDEDDVDGRDAPSKSSPANEGEFEIEGPDEEAESDAVVDPDAKSGATVGLNEEGYQDVASCCCPLEMSVFVERLITHQ